MLEQSDVIDWNIFGQLLEMDEDENERDFSKSIVENYFEQAESTFADMDTALVEGDVQRLSRLGHFLKGSSASLGLVKVQGTCEEIQHLTSLSDSGAESLIKRGRAEYDEAQALLTKFFGKN